LHPCAYRLPHDVRDRLAAALKPLRNRDACMALATFIGRFWTAPKRLGLPFMLDRRALAPVQALGLTEARVRGAIRALERVGFLERMPASGRTHQRTPDGLHRKPVAFVLASDYRDAFSMANKRAADAHDRRSRVGRARHRPTGRGLLWPRQRLGQQTRPNTQVAKHLGLFGREPFQSFQNRSYKTQRWTPPWTAGNWLSRKPRPQGSAIKSTSAQLNRAWAAEGQRGGVGEDG
jgi:hypothetical protein